MNHLSCPVRHDLLVALAISFVLLADSIEGLILYTFGDAVPLSTVARLFAFLVLLSLIISKSRNIASWLLLCSYVLLLTVSIVTHDFSISETRWLFAVFLYLSVILIKIAFSDFYLKYLYWLLFSLLVFNITMGYLGIGKAQYSDGSGAIGFIESGNEMTFFILLLSCMTFTIFETKKVVFVLFIALVLMAGLKGNKAALLGVPIIFIILSNQGILRKLFIGFLFGFGTFFAASYAGVMARMVYYFDKLDLITFIFSSRNLWAVQAISDVLDFELMRFMFGAGYKELIASVGKTVEIDIVDSLFVFGFVGAMFISLLTVSAHYVAFHNLKGRIYLVLLFSALSVFSGHLYFSTSVPLLLMIMKGSKRKHGTLSKSESKRYVGYQSDSIGL